MRGGCQVYGPGPLRGEPAACGIVAWRSAYRAATALQVFRLNRSLALLFKALVAINFVVAVCWATEEMG